MPADFKQGTNLVGTSLATGQLSGTAEVPILTVTAGSAAKVATAILHNSGSTTIASIAVFKTPNVGGTPGTKTRISLITNLAAGDSTSMFELVGSFLEPGCVISAQSSTAAAANYDITGAVSS